MRTVKLAWRFRFALYEILTILAEYIEVRTHYAVTDEDWLRYADRLRRIIDNTNI